MIVSQQQGMYLWLNLCTLYLLACQARVTVVIWAFVVDDDDDDDHFYVVLFSALEQTHHAFCCL